MVTMPGPYGSRLLPLALANAEERCRISHISIQAGGLSPEQLAEAGGDLQFMPPWQPVARLIRRLLRHIRR